jgi:hypothetical protein
MKREKPSLLALSSALFAAALNALVISGCEQPPGPAEEGINYLEKPPSTPAKPELIVWDEALGVEWRTALGAEAYTVYYGTTTRAADAQVWTGAVTLEAGSASAFISGLVNGTRYYVWVSAANSAGVSPKSEYAYAKPQRVVENAPHVFFDHGWMIPSYEESERFYTVRQGESLVLTPVLWRIGDNISYTWKVRGVEQHSGLSGQGNRYFTFTPGSIGNYNVEVTVEEGDAQYSAAAQVVCTGAYTVRAATGESSAKARNAFAYMPAPGQFVGRYPAFNFNAAAAPESVSSTAQAVVNAAGSEWRFSLGAFGGSIITGFDHSVARSADGRAELSIKGNAFDGWAEPGVVWVSRDDNGNGQPDDTWYELKGSQHGSGDTKRYAVTWLKPPSGGLSGAGIWLDSAGGAGTYPVGYPVLSGLEYFTMTGTYVPRNSVSENGAWGYVDIAGQGRFRISDAVQVDGSAANLDYIDFVKVQNAAHEMAGIFGEISTETGVPFDLSIPNPEMRIRGALVSGGEYNGKYSFNFNAADSGYILTIMAGDETFSAGNHTIYADSEYIYFDYYGGNVLHYNSTPGIISFGAR